MSAYEDDADKLADHITEECDDPYCHICMEEEEEEEGEEDDPR